MIMDTLTHSAYDLFDNYNKQALAGQQRQRNRAVRQDKRRKPPQKFTLKGFPVKIKRPTKKQPRILQGRPTKLPPLTNFRKSMNTGVIKPSIMVKNTSIKDKNNPIPKKIGIEKLIKKTAVPQKTQNTIATENKQMVAADKPQKDIENKGQKADSKVGKVVKIISGIAIVGLAGFGIYTYIQYRKKLNVKLKK